MHKVIPLFWYLILAMFSWYLRDGFQELQQKGQRPQEIRPTDLLPVQPQKAVQPHQARAQAQVTLFPAYHTRKAQRQQETQPMDLSPVQPQKAVQPHQARAQAQVTLFPAYHTSKAQRQ